MLRKIFKGFAIGGLIGYGLATGYVQSGGAGMILQSQHHKSAFMHEEYSLSRMMSESVGEGYSQHMAIDGRNVLGIEAGPIGRPQNRLAVVFHNHRDNVLQRIALGNHLRELGFNVYLAEYPSRHPRDSEVEHEQRVLEQIRVQFDYINKRYSGYAISVIGETIGASIAAKAIVTYRLPVEHFVAVNPWRSLSELAKDRITAFPLLHLAAPVEHEFLPYLKAFSGHFTLVSVGNDPDVPAAQGLSVNEEIFGARQEAVWWADGANASDWINHFTPRQREAMLVSFSHLIPIEQPPMMEEDAASEDSQKTGHKEEADSEK